MKRIVSIVLAVMMVFSAVAMVSAATVSDKTTFLPNPIDVEMTVDVLARKSGTSNEYVASLGLMENNIAAGVGVDYVSTLDMAPIRALFDRSIIASGMSGDPDAQAEFEAGTVATEISVKITYPAAANFSADLNTAGNLDAGSIFSEVSRTSVDNTLTIVYKNRDGLTVAELLDNKEAYLKDIAFYLTDSLDYRAAGQYVVKVEMSGSTNVCFASKTQIFNYVGADECLVSLSVPAQPSGGGGVSGLTTKNPVISFESNGGDEHEDIVVTPSKDVTLPTPVRDGYIFDGWYLDEELTVPYDPETKVTQSITLYAKWNRKGDTPGIIHATPDALNGEDHFAYIMGYPDGSVRPDDNINRAEVVTIFFRLLKEEIREQNLVDQSSFADVTADDWYNKAISTMEKLGIVQGKGEGLFAPEDYITRAEFAAICARFDDSEYEVIDSFTDVAGHWAEADIHEAAAYGWIKGYEDGTFKPDQLISRAEAMTMINRVLNRIPESADDLYEEMVVWPDNADVDAWYYLAVQEATNSHTYEKKDDIYETWTGLRENMDWTIYQ